VAIKVAIMDPELKTYATQYEAATERFEALVVGLGDEDLDIKHPDGWSPRQIIHHVADSETQSYARIRRLIAEPLGSVIQRTSRLGMKSWTLQTRLPYFALFVPQLWI
jgi:hypothetical protein